jgi:hypothetical protein
VGETLTETVSRLYAELASKRARCDQLAVQVMDLTDERDRLAVIVDLACAEHEALVRNAPLRDWSSVNDAFVRAVRAEVARRAAL